MKKLAGFVCIAAAMAVALAVSAPVVEAQLECGAEIWENTKLTEDLVCSELEGPPWLAVALYIKGESVTLDLGGHTISGTQRIGVGVAAHGTVGTTIKNGTIEGFAFGVSGGVEAHDLEVKNLLFTDQKRVGVYFVNGAEGVVIKDSSFIGGESPAVSAISFATSSDVSIKNIDATRCYECVSAEESNNVEIKDSTFHDNLWGVFLETISNAKISGNHISGCLDGDLCCVCPFGGGECDDEDELVCSHGIRVEGGTDISIKNNFVHNVWAGITLLNTDDSEISSNHVYNNLESGIVLWDGSTDNRVISNITFGTGDGIGDFDLEHSCSSWSNTWKDNSYVFCKGLEINGCTNPCYGWPE